MSGPINSQCKLHQVVSLFCLLEERKLQSKTAEVFFILHYPDDLLIGKQTLTESHGYLNICVFCSCNRFMPIRSAKSLTKALSPTRSRLQALQYLLKLLQQAQGKTVQGKKDASDIRPYGRVKSDQCDKIAFFERSLEVFINSLQLTKKHQSGGLPWQV